ncbi:hypothetical protein GHK92_11020 [Nocardioides sp. dk4132]|uniref:hypothetical protein n=1 Tax=unclassified Nocardioides TaxID=2615069 RepID=UPI001295267E|nr:MULTISPECIES: hypothetical protein [unclassified Nocardioides]MQW76409.1 hypothetical protein [Nocardioides sp. dk4132]QGA07317.1 hypothetical protein GFH29_07910 [Nocardioides sp. dk884]
MRPSRAATDRWVDLAVGLALTLVILGPLLLGRGFWLFGDMVFVPEQPWKDAWLGLDGQLPRAVPMDALMSALTAVVPGDLVQKAVLLGVFLAGALGAGRLVAGHAWYARAAAITLFVWNPWVHERLLMGQWAILAGYLLLPWVAHAALRARRDLRDGMPPLAVALVLSAVCSPSSGLMAVLVAVVLAARRTRAHVPVVLGTGLVANLPWLVPTLVAARGSEVTVAGVFEVFAPRAESAAGVWASLLSLGGTWKSAVVPPERTEALVVLLACGLTLVALLGVRRAGRGSDERRLLVLAGVSLLLAALPVLPGGTRLLEAVGGVVPGAAVLRDSQRFLAPAVLVLLPGLAVVVSGIRARVRPGREALWGVVVLVVVAPVLLLPSLAWGAAGTLPRSTFPQEWGTVAGILEEEGAARTVVLPWRGGYRGYEWNGRRAVLDPAPRLLPGEVVIDDRTFVDGEVVPSEDPRVGAVDAALAAPDPAAALRAAGVRWVLVEHGMGGVGDVPEGAVRHEGEELTLLDLGADAPSSEATDRGDAALVVLADIATLLLLSGNAAAILRRRV